MVIIYELIILYHQYTSYDIVVGIIIAETLATGHHIPTENINAVNERE